MKHVPTVYCSLALATLLAGCAHQSRPEAARAPAPVAIAEPRPPAGAATGLSLPSPDAQGHYATINSGIADKEAIWHFRAALNVAALSCTDQSIRDNYNQLLKSRKTVFASAYASETRVCTARRSISIRPGSIISLPSRRPRSAFAARPIPKPRKRYRCPRPNSRPMRPRRSIGSKRR